MVELTVIELGMEDGEITKTQLSLEQSAQIKTFHSFQRGEEYLRLKSQILWLLASDKNSVFFHRQCRARLTCTIYQKFPLREKSLQDMNL